MSTPQTDYSLQQLERLLTDALDPFADPAAMRDAANLVTQCGKLTPEKRLRIYQHNISSAYIDVLETVFPTCRAVLGERTFATLARDYAWNALSETSDLNLFGRDFPAALRAWSRAGTESMAYDYLHDLAVLEYGWHSAYYRPDNESFDFTAFAQAQDQPHRLIFQVSQSVFLMETSWPVLTLWQQYRDDALGHAVAALVGSQYLCISRPGYEPRIDVIDQSVCRLLTLCRAGHSLEQLVADEAASQALEKLPELIRTGWVCGFTIEPRE